MLTPRETQILRLLAQGHTSTEIAEHLVLAATTVRSYIKTLYAKLGVNRRYDAINLAREHKLL